MRSSNPRGGSGQRDGHVVEVRLGPQFTPGVRAVLILFAVTYLLGLIPPLDALITQHLILWPMAAIGREPYQLITAPLIMNSLIALLFVGLLLWQIGSAIEERVGTRTFLWWLASTSLVSTLTSALIGRVWPTQGSLPLSIDGHPLFPVILLAFGHYYGTTQARMWGIGDPVSGRGLAYFFVGIGLAASLLAGRYLTFFGQLAAIGWALLLLHRPLRHLRRPAKRKLGVVDGGQPWRASKSEQRWLN